MILASYCRDGFEVEVSQSQTFARFETLLAVASTIPAGWSLRPAAGRLLFVDEPPTVTDVTIDALDPRRVTLDLVDGLASWALVAGLRGLAASVPCDFIVAVTATEIILQHPDDHAGGEKSAGAIELEADYSKLPLPPRDWPSRIRDSGVAREHPVSG